MENPEVFAAIFDHKAVGCPHGGGKCGTHNDCSQVCGEIREEVLYGLPGWGHGIGRPEDPYDPHVLLVNPPRRFIQETAQHLRNLTRNNIPLATVKSFSEQERLNERRAPWWVGV